MVVVDRMPRDGNEILTDLYGDIDENGFICVYGAVSGHDGRTVADKRLCEEQIG